MSDGRRLSTANGLRFNRIRAKAQRGGQRDRRLFAAQMRPGDRGQDATTREVAKLHHRIDPAERIKGPGRAIRPIYPNRNAPAGFQLVQIADGDAVVAGERKPVYKDSFAH